MKILMNMGSIWMSMCLCRWIQWPITSNHLSIQFVISFLSPEFHKNFDTFCESETSLGKAFIPLVAQKATNSLSNFR